MKRLDENIRILQRFKINERYLMRKLKVCVNQHDFVSYTNYFTLMIFFVFSSVINEFHNKINKLYVTGNVIESLHDITFCPAILIVITLGQ